MPTLAGTKLDKYDMLEEVGHGGMAVVYRGRDRVLEREVAVKVLHPHLADREESRERLRREAVAVAKLRHENILEIFDYSGLGAAESYIVTEFIHGPTLRDWMDEAFQPRPAVAAMIVHRLALALSCAHKGSIVHRDIKPENVMIRRDDGCIKLMDFGIAQILDNQKLTMTGQLIGSPAYMAPELISGRPLDARTDLFSLGILLYQLATGELPFAGRNPHEVLNRIADGNYTPPSNVCSLVDHEIETIIARALANNPDERFQSADELARDLEDYLAEMELEPAPTELCRYFLDPAEYIRELDARVSTALMFQAEKAAREGLHGRAIRLLGRVLELDKDHKAARSLLVRLRVRERRLRQVLVGGATLGLAGLLTAGYVLLPPPASDGARSQIADEPDDGLLSHARATDQPSVPVMPPPKRVEPPRESATGPEAAEGGVVPNEGGAEGEAETTGADRGKTKAGRDPQRTATPKVNCVLTVKGIPQPTATTLSVLVGKESMKVGPDATVRFELGGPKVFVEIDDNIYSGKRTVTAADCSAGDVRLKVSPLDAIVRFPGTGKKTAVSCVKGCPGDVTGKWYTVDDFPALPFDDGETERRISLEFKAEQHESKRITKTVYGGRNDITVGLEPSPGE